MLVCLADRGCDVTNNGKGGGVLTKPLLATPKTEVLSTSTGYRPFPVNVLPEPIRGLVEAGASAIGCDPAYIALPALAVAAGAIGHTARVRLKRSWSEPAILWTCAVGESGELKTQGYKLAVKPLLDLQAQRFKEHAEAEKRYQADLLRYEVDRAAYVKDRSTGEPPEKPEPPGAVRHVVSDTTIEALAPILLANPRGVLLARDELAAWIGGFDRYANGKAGGDAQAWINMHQAGAVVVDRRTSGTIYVPHATVSVTGTIQPGVLRRVMTNEHHESGLLARLLLAMPPRRQRMWTDADIPRRTEDGYADLVVRLCGLAADRDPAGDPVPRLIGLTPEGKDAWVAFYNEHAREQAELVGDLAAAWSKLEGYAARLALVLHVVRTVTGDAAADAVDVQSVEAGITLSKWFAGEVVRVYGVLQETQEDRDKRLVVELIQRLGGSVTPRDLQRHSRMFPTADDAAGFLNLLSEAGLGAWETPPPGETGGRPTQRFVLTCAVDVDKTPCSGPENGGFVNGEEEPYGEAEPYGEGEPYGWTAESAADDIERPDPATPGALAMAAPEPHVPEGWSPERWARELRRMAIACRDVNPARAAELDDEADRLECLFEVG